MTSEKTTEMLLEMRDSTVRIEEGIKTIDKRLDTLNSKVASHVKEIAELQKTDSQVMARMAPLFEHLEEEKQDKKTKGTFWYERLTWIGVLILAAVLNATGILNFKL